ncbi:MAG: regulatory protein RecX [Alphaproteobacteria bacterium]
MKKITKTRLKNIALYYLQRYEASTKSLSDVLKRRVDKYAFENKDWQEKNDAYKWILEVVEELEGYKYVDDDRFAKIKVESYLRAGKSLRYIKEKLSLKGIKEDVINQLAEELEYSAYDNALKIAQKKKLGTYKENYTQETLQKDFAKMMRYGFDYETIKNVFKNIEEF